jgi:AcrR family transcriptional regulator
MATRPGAVEAAHEEPVKTQSLRAEHKRATRERLISAAVELFAQHGYRATSVGEIARIAGTTPTTFYRYFSSKSEVARLLQDRISIEIGRHFRALDEIKPPTRQALRSWVEQYGHLWRGVHVLWHAYWEAITTDPDLAAGAVPKMYRLTGSMNLVEAMSQGPHRERFQSRLVLMHLLMERLFYLVDIQGHDATANKMIDEFSDILWESLFAAH